MTDVFEQEMPADVEAGGNFLSAEGTYHLVVLEVEMNPTSKRSSKMLRGFKVKFSVLAGTVDGQKGKEVDLTFFDADLTKPQDQQDRNRRDQARFWIAIGLANKGDKKISASCSAARGRHCVARLGTYNNFLQLQFGEIYHVDDPEVASVPKDTAAIDALPADRRRIGSKPAAKADQEYSETVETKSAVSIDDL